MKCEGLFCEAVATMAMHWEEKPWVPLCQECSLRVIEIARTAGITAVLESIVVAKKRDESQKETPPPKSRG